MNQNQLLYFTEVYRCRNIQHAALHLSVSRQGISKVIRSLEQELGKTLFERSPSGVNPTEFASALYPHALNLLNEYNYIAGMNTLSYHDTVLTIYSMEHFFAYLSSDFLMDFKKRYPDITLNITDMSDDAILNGITVQSCDLGIVNGPLDFTQFRGTPLFFSHYVARIHRTHPFAQKEFLTLADLHGETIVGKGRGYRCFRSNLNLHLLQPGYKVNILAEVSDELLLTELVRKNHAISIGFDFSASLFPDEDIVTLPLYPFEMGSTLYLTERIDAPSSGPLLQFKSFLTEWIITHKKNQPVAGK